MGISVKRLRENDWQELRSMRLKALESDPSVFGSHYEKESALTEAEWRSWLQTDNDAATFVLYEDDVPVGMTGIGVDREDPTKKRAVLWGSWLEPRVRGKGLSNIMYAERIAWAKQHPTIETIVVSHRASNTASKRAILKHGFIPTHNVEEVWPDGTREERVSYALAVKSPGHQEIS